MSYTLAIITVGLLKKLWHSHNDCLLLRLCGDGLRWYWDGLLLQ